MEKKAKKYEITVVGTDSDMESVQIRGSKDAEQFARKFYHEDIVIYESVFIMLLNRANKVTGWAKISQGGVCASLVDIKIVCKYAVDTLANGVILVHNHPSGSEKPGKQDIALTSDLKKALKLFDVSLLDHVIITEDSYYSFSDECAI